jgi:hypothetical protein
VFEVRLCLPGIPHLSHNPLQRWSLMRAHPRPLLEVFSAIPAFRKPRGKRHPFTAIFALACCAMLGGARSDSAISAWRRNDGTRIAQALGFTHAAPYAATLHTIFGHMDRDAFETHLGAWADSVVGSLPAPPEGPEPAVALDGQTLRGAKNQARRAPTCYRRWRARSA